MTSREQRLTTKFLEHIATHTNLILWFNVTHSISKVKNSRTCLIGYSDFISREYVVAHSLKGEHTHTHITNHEKDDRTYLKSGTVTKKTAGYKVRQTTVAFLVFICKM